MLAAIAAAVLFSFGGLLSAPFQFDDHAILADPAITSPSGWREVWRPSQTRPLTYFTFWLNHAVGGESPVGYHAVNLALHLASSALVWICLRRLIPGQAAAIAAFVFAVHPAQTEAVAYVFARSTLLCTLLCLASLLPWTRGSRWWAAAAFGAALLAKEECAAFPAFLLLLHWAGSRDRAERVPLAAMFAMAAAFAARVAFLAAVTPGSGAGQQSGFGATQYFLTQGFAILRYFQLLAIPVGFTVDPAIPLMADWRGVVSWAAILFAAFVASRSFRGPGAGFWFLAGMVLLMPTSSIFPAQDLAADRRLYLPMLGFAAFTGLIVRRTSFPILLAAGGAVLCMLSYARADVWKSELALWEDAMRWAPDKLRPRLQAARAADPGTGLRLLEDARNRAPGDPTVASELGRLHLANGRPSEALREFGRALALQPGDPLALNQRGVALFQLGLREPAIADFRHALDADACQFDARYNLRKAGIFTEVPEHCRWPESRVRLWQAP